MSYIWFVEDSVSQLEELTRLFREDLGLKVQSFQTARDLLAAIEKLPRPDVVVLDLALIGTLNGFQLGEEILKRRDDISPRQFFFLSGWSAQFTPLKPGIFELNALISKGNWTRDQ